MREGASETAKRRDPQIHQEADQQVVETEAETFWRNCYRQANQISYRVAEQNRELEWRIEQLEKQLSYSQKRLDSAIAWWRELENDQDKT